MTMVCLRCSPFHPLDSVRWFGVLGEWRWRRPLLRPMREPGSRFTTMFVKTLGNPMWLSGLHFVLSMRVADVFEPSAEMVERDRDAQGEEQSFEFPALVVGDDGAVDLFGRGSHNYYRQRVNALGFGPREAFERWGVGGVEAGESRWRS